MSRGPRGADDLEANLLIRSLALGLGPRTRIDPHEHTWPQLVYAAHGVLKVTMDGGTWVVPPQRAVWVRPGVQHELFSLGDVALRTLYLEPAFAGPLPARSSVLHVAPLLRELILETISRAHLDRREPDQERLAGVICDQLTRCTELPAELPHPRDPRACAVAAKITTNPGGRETLDALAEGSGAAPRTIERLFARETSMTLRRWRQQARLIHAVGLLADGHPVTEVALRSGYDSTSAFISMFRRTLGATPGQYFRRE